MSLRIVPGLAADNNAAGAAGPGVVVAISHLQAALHQHPDTVLYDEHWPRPGVRHRTATVAWRSRVRQGQVSGIVVIILIIF